MSVGIVFDIGDTNEISAEFRVTSTDTLFDPNTVDVVIHKPSGAKYTLVYPDPNLVRDSVGKFRALVPCTEAGLWNAFWTAGGGIPGASQTRWMVRAEG